MSSINLEIEKVMLYAEGEVGKANIQANTSIQIANTLKLRSQINTKGNL